MRHYLDEQADAAEEREARERVVLTPHLARVAIRISAELRRRDEAQTIHDARKALYFRYREGRASGDPVSASGLARVASELWPC